jgi:PTH1 family peptidyl-tRNA hydrolase
MDTRRLIIGLGNPGREYEKTRHNIGFRLIQALLAKESITPIKEKFFPGLYGHKKMHDFQVVYLMPLTFMNHSGAGVRRCMEYFKINAQNILVIADDVAIPFGSMRLRPFGSSGGHNGLKSVQQWLGSEHYSRLRVGVGQPLQVPLESYVLQNLDETEELKWPKIEQGALALIQEWIGHTQLSRSWVLNELI